MSKSPCPFYLYAGVACLLILVPLAATQATTLTAGRLPSYPFAISNNAVTSVDHGDGTYTLYSFMGMRNPTIAASVTPFSFKLEGPNGSWTRIANAPRLEGKAKVGASAISVAGEVYLIGGYTLGANERTEKRLFRYAADTDEYVELSPVPVEVDDTVVDVDSFAISRVPVTNEQFATLVDAGGYENPAWWTAAGPERTV